LIIPPEDAKGSPSQVLFQELVHDVDSYNKDGKLRQPHQRAPEDYDEYHCQNQKYQVSLISLESAHDVYDALMV